MPKEKAQAIIIRKPIDMDDLEKQTKARSIDDIELVVVVETIDLDKKNYDALIDNFFDTFSFISRKGGDDKWIRVTSKGRPSLLINPEGYDYARYVGIEITGKRTAVVNTQNPEWGFYGTIRSAGGFSEAVTKKIWLEMVGKIKSLYPEKKDFEIMRFLDNRIGRHLADRLVDMQGQITSGKVLHNIAKLTIEEMRQWWSYYYARG
ncbi:MAG: hypothetical protein LBT45_03585 [Rickettsiales bacterium]|jgi:hypothetical protein|nr:hypothetical protein [Rickettsiales bacterium]